MRLSLRSWLFAAVVAALCLAVLSPAAAQASCSFRSGFKALRDLIPEQVGDCLEDERVNPYSTLTEQRTTRGLLVWRAVDNWTGFTNGSRTWIIGRDGLVSRPNAGPLYVWEYAQGATPPPGDRRVLWSDDFDDPARAGLPTSATASASRAYLAGEYQLRWLQTTSAGYVFASLPSIYRNAALVVDARLVGGAARRFLVLSCRRSVPADAAPQPASGYQVTIDPDGSRFTILRLDLGRPTSLLAWTETPALYPGGARNHFAMDCDGPTIRLNINGTDVAEVEDSTYSEGRMLIGAGVESGAGVTSEARFDNLVVTSR